MATTGLVPWVILQLLVIWVDIGSAGGIGAGKKRKGMSETLKDWSILSSRCVRDIHVGGFIHKEEDAPDPFVTEEVNLNGAKGDWFPRDAVIRQPNGPSTGPSCLEKEKDKHTGQRNVLDLLRKREWVR